jgi:uncharacterized membrane protein
MLQLADEAAVIRQEGGKVRVKHLADLVDSGAFGA